MSHREISDLAARFALAVDLDQLESLRALLAPDFLFEISDEKHLDAAELMYFLKGQKKQRISFHLLGPTVVTEQAVDCISAVTPVVTYRRPREGGAGDMVPSVIGRYHDIFHKAADGWKFHRRRVVVDSMRAM
jgi:hypothetical protein